MLKRKRFKTNFNSGYIGLVMLLISFVIIALIIVRTDLFSGQKGSKNVLEQGTDAINKTKDVKTLLEKNSQPLPE